MTMDLVNKLFQIDDKKSKNHVVFTCRYCGTRIVVHKNLENLNTCTSRLVRHLTTHFNGETPPFTPDE